MSESCFKMIKTSGIIHHLYFFHDPYRLKITELSSQGSELEFMFDEEIKEELIESLNDKELFQLEQDCPICFEDSIWASIGLDDHLTIKINGLGCLKCLYIIKDKDVLEIFFNSKLEAAEILKFKSELGV